MEECASSEGASGVAGGTAAHSLPEQQPFSSSPSAAIEWPVTRRVARLDLAQVEARLEVASQREEETEAMVLLAEREQAELRAAREALQEANDRLNSQVGERSKRERRNLHERAHFSDVYDWVCEITRLSDASRGGWRVEYSESFVRSLGEDERRAVMGIGPDGGGAMSDASDDDTSSVGGGSCRDSAHGGGGGAWEGAVVAVLGLFDKGKTFVLNHLTDQALPSGKKVSTKGLSFKHVDVENTKFILLDSEGSYAPVRVENELSVVEKEMTEHFIEDVIFDLADYFLCVVNDFTSLDQRYLDKLTRSLQNSKKVFKEVIVVHNCKTIMEAEVLEHIFATQICSIYGAGKAQTTRVAAPNPLDGGNLEDRDVHWFKTDFSRHVILANKDCELGDATNPWAFALLRYWLKAVFVPVNRRFTVLQSVLRACNTRIHAYFKAHPELSVVDSDDARVKLLRAGTQREGVRLPQASVDASGLMVSRPNSFQPSVDIVRDKAYTIYMDVPGLTKDDIRLSRQNVTTIVKGGRTRPYNELQAVTQVERAERRYGDFTQTFRIPQEYERKWKHCSVTHGVLKMSFTQDTDEEGVPLDLQTPPPD